jgi:HEAT repeat protein
VAEIQRGGRENILGLIEMLGLPGSDPDVKPHYALHCVGNLTLQRRDEPARREFAETLAGQLQSDRPKHVRSYLCQELQWAGRKEACPALGSLLADDELVDPAAAALLAIRDGAVEQFRAALPSAKGRCRLAIVQSLGVLKDLESAAALRQAAEDPDREVRMAALWGLANMGDAASAELVTKKADGSQGWERIQAHKACLLLAERLAAAGAKDPSRRIYAHLKQTRTEPSEAYIRDAAERGLSALA